MAKIPEVVLQATVQAIYAWHEKRQASEPPRQYLGWSEVGNPCTRALWYGFRMATASSFDGRMLRLFDTGHREEERVLHELQSIGCEVFSRDPETGRQFGCQSFGGHLRGHLDAVVKGLPEAPKTAHLVDVKTCNIKKFAELQKKGLREVYPKYWAQAHGYMGQFGLTRAMYIFVVKDTDQLHTERFEFDEAEYRRQLDRAEQAIFSTEPPERISNDPAWFECRFCQHHAACHGTQTPRVNCRTCAHSTPQTDGTWQCEQGTIRPIDFQRQQSGCEQHRFIPAVLHWAEQVDASADENWIRYRHKEAGFEFTNGLHPSHIDSHEMLACEDKTALAIMNDPQWQKLRRTQGARIVK